MVKGKRLLIAGVLLATVVLLNLPAPDSLMLRDCVRDNLAPFQNFMSLAIGRVHDAAQAVRAGQTSAEERRELLTRIALLESQLHEFRGFQEENALLLASVNATNRFDRRRMVFCEVTARGDAVGWWHTLTLNRGSSDGIKPDLAVVGVKGLVGKTSRVSWRTTEVLLITDPNCKVPCRTAGGAEFGILEGRGVSLAGRHRLEMLSAVNPIRVDYVPLEMPLHGGDVVETSGLGGILPPGIAVGRVIEAGMDPSGLYQRADVMPSADLASLRYVFVVTDDASLKKGEAAK